MRGVDLKHPLFSETQCHEFMIGDLRDPQFAARAIDRRFDEVYQLAADMGGAGFVFTHIDEDVALRSDPVAIAAELRTEIQDRLVQAGVEVIEARISHLAYAPEIANAMLRRQQANAVIAARTRIVEGAVGMVEMALEQLSSKGVIELDEERKATMVSNLLVVLCSEHETQPVVNTGSLYA